MSAIRRHHIFALTLTLAAFGCDDDTAADPDMGGAGADAAGGTGGTGGMGGAPDSDGGPDDPDGDTPDAEPDAEPLPQGGEFTITLAPAFAPGTAVREAYTGATATVADDGTVSVDIPAGGVALFERADTDLDAWPFDWDNATVYFAITDRFENGDPSNDNSHGRRPDGADEIGTWHGGDWAGLTARLDHIDALGASAIWISAPYEQIHGWVGGGDGDFKHYAYHGYWALDFTTPDPNWGTPDELRTLIREAHARGIRVVFDVVMNHPGYAALDDLVDYLPEVLLPGYEDWLDRDSAPSWHDWNDFVDYESLAWLDWWGNRWIRAGFPMHPRAGMTDTNRSLAFLPDFLTEDFRTVPALPGLLTRKGMLHGTNAEFIDDATVRQHLVRWLSDWVREYGIDGFRCDTAKHVELASWAALKEASVEALREWKAANPGQSVGDDDFWMVGEVFPHGVVRDDYFDNGFDALINFDFQDAARGLAADVDALDATYALYAEALNPVPGFNVMSYISSHDTTLFYETTGQSVPLQYAIGAALLLAPGAVQIYYGDETARPGGPPSSDEVQATRSDMNWDDHDPALLAHWQRIGTFRRRHPAIGAGAHEALSTDGDTYTFARRLELDDGSVDEVVIAIPRVAD